MLEELNPMKKIVTAIAIMALPFAAQAADKSRDDIQADKIFDRSDTNKDGVVSKDEYTKEEMDKFAQFDRNKDDQLSKTEHEQLAMEVHDELMGKTVSATQPRKSS